MRGEDKLEIKNEMEWERIEKRKWRRRREGKMEEESGGGRASKGSKVIYQEM